MIFIAILFFIGAWFLGKDLPQDPRWLLAMLSAIFIILSAIYEQLQNRAK
jgi:uncharacterized membrane protein